MNEKSKDELLYLALSASHSRKCQHLYLRGNFQQDIFFDKVDMINVWNRIWLSAKATGVQILSVKILNNHLHLTAIIQNDDQRANFKHHLRLSITQYHNKRYKVHGTVGTRRLNHGLIKDLEDLKDCICYHIRNILHHGINRDYLNYPFSTVRYAFGLAGDKQKGIYTYDTLPNNLACAYLPSRGRLPEGWQMTTEGLIVPPPEIFRSDIIEALFGTREQYLESLKKKTSREITGEDEPKLAHYASDSCKVPTLDEQVVEFMKGKSDMPIPSMNTNQKMAAIRQILETFPNANLKLLTRLFGIPYSTLRYRLKCWHFPRVTRGKC